MFGVDQSLTLQIDKAFLVVPKEGIVLEMCLE